MEGLERLKVSWKGREVLVTGATGERATVIEVVGMITKKMGLPVKPGYTLDEGLDATIPWYREVFS